MQNSFGNSDFENNNLHQMTSLLVFQSYSKVLRAWSQVQVVRGGENKAESYVTLYNRIAQATTSGEAQGTGATLRSAAQRHRWHCQSRNAGTRHPVQSSSARVHHCPTPTLYTPPAFSSKTGDQNTAESKEDCHVNLAFNLTL